MLAWRVTIECNGVEHVLLLFGPLHQSDRVLNKALESLGLPAGDYRPVCRFVMMPPDCVVVLPAFNELDPPGSSVMYWWLRTLDWKLDEPRYMRAVAKHHKTVTPSNYAQSQHD